MVKGPRVPRRTYSIRTIILMPMILAIVIFMLVFVLKWQYDYNWLAENQGNQILSEINRNIKDQIYEMLQHPLRMNQLLAAQISENHTYDQENLEALQDDLYLFYKTIYEEAPQVSAIRYGDEQGRFVGYRTNQTLDQTNLMLKDERTNNTLNIYEGIEETDPISESYASYDPTTRSWYGPVRTSKEAQWTDIYMSDSLKTPMLSSTYPILDDQGQVIGVTDIGIRMNNIDSYLYNNRRDDDNIVYIVNDDWDLIASSDLEKEMIKAYESGNTIIRESAIALEDHLHYQEEMVRINIGGTYYLALVSVLTEPINIHWHIIVATPEEELMGLVKTRQNQTTLYMVVLLIILLILASFMMRLITEPILQLKMATEKMNFDNLDQLEALDTDKPLPFLSEINSLKETLDNMRLRMSAAYKEIRLSEEKYRSLVENVEDFIFMMTPEMILVTVNEAFENFVQSDKEALLGHKITNFLNDKEVIFWRAVVSSVKATQETMRFRRRFIMEDGEAKIVKMTLIPIFDEDHQLIFILASSSDVTELVETQNALTSVHIKEKEMLEMRVAERTQALEQAMIEISEREKMASLAVLVSGVAHEINTPLGIAVSANSYLESERKKLESQLMEGSLSKDDFIEYLEAFEESGDMIKSNLNRAAKLVKSFKAIAVKQSHDEIESFDVKEYLDATITSLKHVNKGVDAKISVNCPEGMMIRSYPGAFSQVLTNLMENSMKHAFSTVEDPKIDIHVETADEDHVKLIYQDNGAGISSDVIHKIFDPFFTTNRSEGGSGLGLNIVYNLVTNQMKGKIRCESELTHFTRFIILIPKAIKREGEEDEQQVE